MHQKKDNIPQYPSAWLRDRHEALQPSEENFQTQPSHKRERRREPSHEHLQAHLEPVEGVYDTRNHGSREWTSGIHRHLVRGEHRDLGSAQVMVKKGEIRLRANALNAIEAAECGRYNSAFDFEKEKSFSYGLSMHNNACRPVRI